MRLEDRDVRASTSIVSLVPAALYIDVRSKHIENLVYTSNDSARTRSPVQQTQQQFGLCAYLLEVARCGLVAVLEGWLLETAPNELEQVVVPDAMVSVAVVVEQRLPCLEDASRSRFREPRDLPAVNCRPARRGVPATEVAVFAFLAGALEGRSNVPEVPLVCAARISGAISAISGSEFGAETAARRLADSLPLPSAAAARCVPSGSRR